MNWENNVMEDLKNYIWTIADAYRGITHAGNIIPAIIRFIFAKYAVDNYLFAVDVEDMKEYADIQRSMSFRSEEAAHRFVEALHPILEKIDRHIGVDGLLSRAHSYYYDDILGTYNKKKTYSSSSASMILDLFGSMDFRDVSGDELINSLKACIYSYANTAGRYGGEYITSDSLNRLAKKLLQVSDNETIRDFACGFGLSGLSVVEGTDSKLILSDIREENIQLSIMLNVIAGRYNTKYEVGNSLYRKEEEELADALYTDFPLNIKLSPEDRDIYHTNSGNIAAIRRTIELLKDGGRAFITCPGSVLFGSSRDAVSLRMDLTISGILKAVVTLPTLIYGASVNVNVLLLSKMINKSVTFINASTNDVYQFSNKARGSDVELTDDGIARICSIINEKQDIVGVSKNIDTYILAKGKSLVPTTYIEQPTKEDNISIREIEDELATLYEVLNTLK